MKKRLDIVEVETRKSKSGKDYRVCQCIVHDTEGHKRVGELMVFKPETELPVKEGSYIADFEVSVNWERVVGAELVNLHPFQSGPVTASAGGKAA